MLCCWAPLKPPSCCCCWCWRCCGAIPLLPGHRLRQETLRAGTDVLLPMVSSAGSERGLTYLRRIQFGELYLLLILSNTPVPIWSEFSWSLWWVTGECRNSSDLYFGKIGFLLTGGGNDVVGVLLIETEELNWVLSSTPNVLLVVVVVGAGGSCGGEFAASASRILDADRKESTDSVSGGGYPVNACCSDNQFCIRSWLRLSNQMFWCEWACCRVVLLL